MDQDAHNLWCPTAPANEERTSSEPPHHPPNTRPSLQKQGSHGEDSVLIAARPPHRGLPCFNYILHLLVGLFQRFVPTKTNVQFLARLLLARACFAPCSWLLASCVIALARGCFACLLAEMPKWLEPKKHPGGKTTPNINDSFVVWVDYTCEAYPIVAA